MQKEDFELIFKENELFNCYLEELDEKQMSELDMFHANGVFLHKENDNYFCGIRANTFVVEFGSSENNDDGCCILISANHKGKRALAYAKGIKSYTFIDYLIRRDVQEKQYLFEEDSKDSSTSI